MPEQPESPLRPAPVALLERMRAIPGLIPLVAEAEATWRSRAAAAWGDVEADPDGPDEQDRQGALPGWRAFEDAFPTFYEFTNRRR